MKKFYAFLAAALMSVSVFAAKDVVPTDAVLADYYDQGNVCVCFFVPADMVCNDIVLTGSFNGWSSDLAKCAKTEAVEGYDGWYVGSFEPEAEPDAEKGIQAKPILLDGAGAFNWDSQVGDAVAIRGGVTVVKGSYEGEIDLTNYGVDAPNVFTVEAWKKNPCTAIYHNYTITVVSAGCGGYVVPFIAGSMTSWTDNGWTQMQYSPEKSAQYDNVPTYTFSFKGAEGSGYQIVSGKMNEQGDIDSTAMPGWYDDAYIQVLVNGKWTRLNPNNSFTGEEAEIVWDLRVDTLQWARCDESPTFEVTVALKAPAGAPEAGIELVGAFEKDGWGNNPVTMIWNPSTGYFDGTVAAAKATQAFKFRETGNWDNQILYYEGGTEEEPLDLWLTFGDGNKDLLFGDFWGEGETKAISLDFSNPDEFKWQVPAEEGIEEIVLTEKARKVVVDGQLYIVRDNKLFNVTGAQVR